MTYNLDNPDKLLSGINHPLDQPDSPVFIKNPENDKVVEVNSAALDLLKASRKDFLDQNFSTILDKYFETDSYEKLRLDGRLYSIDQVKVELSGRKLDWIILKPVILVHAEDSKAFLQKMAEVLIHRLRSPLTGMMGFADLIDENAADTTTRRYIEKIKTGLNDLSHSLSRIEGLSEEIVVQKSRFKTSRFIDDLLNEFSCLQRDSIHVQQTTDEVIETDYVLLKSILGELIKNALEQTPGSDIHIRVPSKGTFRVANSGTTIKPELVTKIFFPFFSLKARNIGLGLTISKLRAEAIGGSLRLVENSVKKGVVFELKVS